MGLGIGNARGGIVSVTRDRTSSVLVRPFVGVFAAGSSKADVSIRVASGPQRIGKLVCVAAEQIQRLGPLKRQHYNHPVRILGVGLHGKPNMAKLFRRQRNLGLSACAVNKCPCKLTDKSRQVLQADRSG